MITAAARGFVGLACAAGDSAPGGPGGPASGLGSRASGEPAFFKTMYRYSESDRRLLGERVAQFRDQTRRYLAGELSDEAFRPLRLQNGLYLQRLAPMLRVSIPYGMLSSAQLRRLAWIARRYDKGYGHFSTRQNIQFNWPRLEEAPEILASLAEADMHAIQTSGNCIRNITTDELAGVAPDEIADPRPWCELIRQWAAFHPEFAFLPRKFKIAVNASTRADRAASRVHDIGVELVRAGGARDAGFRIWAGGGLGRTPVVGSVVREFLPAADLLSYLEAILRVYNQFGRRDNRYKARIKILVRALGVEEFSRRVEAEWESFRDGPMRLDERAVAEAAAFFPQPAYPAVERVDDELARWRMERPEFARWLRHNVAEHKQPGYAIVTVALKTVGVAPGDIDDAQMDALADLADRHSGGELRSAHGQNLLLADVPAGELPELWQALSRWQLAAPVAGTIQDVICCPGGDFCSLANAKSIPVAETLQRAFDDADTLRDIGDVRIKISGCMNACGHHHVGDIGILGVDRKGAECYQVSVGGASGRDAAIGTILGPAFAVDALAKAVEAVVACYRAERAAGESFADTFRRIGVEPFRAAAYPDRPVRAERRVAAVA